MAVGISTWQKLQNLVAGSTYIYGKLNRMQGNQRVQEISYYDGDTRYEITFPVGQWVEMTTLLPQTQAGRDLLLNQQMELFVRGNTLGIASPSEVGGGVTPPPGPPPPGQLHARFIRYNPNTSGMVATNVQDAIDELDSRVDALEGGVGHTHANKPELDLITDAGSGDIITSAERVELSTAYIHSQVVGGNPHGTTAGNTPYSNTTSGLPSVDVQGAIDALDVSVDSLLSSQHTHANKTVLDALIDAGSGSVITLVERSKLTGIEDNAKDDQFASEVPYNNSASGLTATNLQAAIDELDGTVDLLVIDQHTHANKVALDLITTAGSGDIITTVERSKLSGIENNAKDDQDAAEVPYVNTTSSLAATDVQAAIDELDAALDIDIISPKDIIWIAKNPPPSSDGTFGKPFGTFAAAVASITTPGSRVQFRVAPGIFDEDVILANNNIAALHIVGSGLSTTRIRSLELGSGQNHVVQLDDISVDQSATGATTDAGLYIGNPGIGNAAIVRIGRARIETVGSNHAVDISATNGAVSLAVTEMGALRAVAGKALQIVNNGPDLVDADLRGTIESTNSYPVTIDGDNIRIRVDTSEVTAGSGNYAAFNGLGSGPFSNRILALNNSQIAGVGTRPAVEGQWTMLQMSDIGIDGGPGNVYEVSITGAVQVGGALRSDGTSARINATSIVYREKAETTEYDDTATSLGVDNVQDALEHLVANSLVGQASLVAADTIAVTFGTPLTSTNYAVLLTGDGSYGLWVENKQLTGFDIKVTASVTGTVDWLVRKL